eukprot:10159022-Heterocapsa_arctica.AAC.1
MNARRGANFARRSGGKEPAAYIGCSAGSAGNNTKPQLFSMLAVAAMSQAAGRSVGQLGRWMVSPMRKHASAYKIGAPRASGMYGTDLGGDVIRMPRRAGNADRSAGPRHAEPLTWCCRANSGLQAARPTRPCRVVPRNAALPAKVPATAGLR